MYYLIVNLKYRVSNILDSAIGRHRPADAAAAAALENDPHVPAKGGGHPTNGSPMRRRGARSGAFYQVGADHLGQLAKHSLSILAWPLQHVNVYGEKLERIGKE